MKTILLVRTTDEGKAYAQGADLDPRETWIITPDKSALRILEGMRMSNEDLVAEFPGFREHPDSYIAIQVLNRNMAKGLTKPAWRKIGT